MVLTAVIAALGSACGFAISTSLQHRAVTVSAPSSRRSGGLFKFLLRSPAWLLGLLVGGLAFTLHAVAVKHGALAVVQPIMVSGLVFALPVRAALDRQRPKKSDLAWAAVTATGLALFVIAANPATGAGDSRNVPAMIFMLVGLTAAFVFSRIGVKSKSAMRRGVLLGSAAGILFGVVAGILKIVVLDASEGQVNYWAISALILLGLWGIGLNQRAYQVAPLSVSMPILNVVAVVVAIAFGYYVFHEVPAHQAGALAAEIGGMVLMGLGVRQLTRGEVDTAQVPAPTPPNPMSTAMMAGVGSNQ